MSDSPFNLAKLRAELDDRSTDPGVNERSPIIVHGTLADGREFSALVVATSASEDSDDGEPEAVYLSVVEVIDTDDSRSFNA